MVRNLRRAGGTSRSEHRAGVASDGAQLNKAAKFARQILQIRAALGAYLALENQISAGAIVASSIIMGHAGASRRRSVSGRVLCRPARLMHD
jgi:ABC-type protease/lipase transport system fused ATPase/permease subunit